VTVTLTFVMSSLSCLFGDGDYSLTFVVFVLTGWTSVCRCCSCILQLEKLRSNWKDYFVLIRCNLAGSSIPSTYLFNLLFILELYNTHDGLKRTYLEVMYEIQHILFFRYTY